MSKGGSQCVLNVCVSAPPNFDCRYIDEQHCETLVSGSFTAHELAKHIPTLRDAPPPQFMQGFVVTRTHPILEKAGIIEGDTITHVHMAKNKYAKFPRTLKQFAALVLKMRRGDRLFVMRQDGRREWIEL